MKQNKTSKELRRLSELLEELVETKGCTEGRNKNCTMTYVHNANTGNTARFQIDLEAKNPKRGSVAQVKEALEKAALETNHTIIFEDHTEEEYWIAAFTHNTLNEANGFTKAQIWNELQEEVNWEAFL